MQDQLQHPDADEIRSLLEGGCADEAARRLEGHIENCNQCRLALEHMAADPDWWQKASTLLGGATLCDTAGLAFEHREVAAQPDSSDPSSFAINEVLQQPRHPEMLGRLDQYDIERELGRGGMGVVLKAFDSELNRPLAIKIMAPHLAGNGAARKRFAREARAAAAVLHPNVIAIHGVNSQGPTPYLVMPYVSGSSLQQLVENAGPLDEKDIVRVALQIAAGLSAAHSQGLIHRDIKPANILIEQSVSRVIITDFGLARAEDDLSMTQTGWFAGTPNFMSPEQARGEDVDQRSDLFSLGSVMYFMATGHLPFRAENPMAVLDRIRNDHPTSVRSVNSDISQTLADIIQALLCKKPQDRFASAGEVHQILEQLLAFLHQPNFARKPSVSRNSKQLLRRVLKLWPAPLLAAAVVMIFFFSGWFGGPDPEGLAKKFAAEQRSIAKQYGLISDDDFVQGVSSLQSELLELAMKPESTGDELVPDTDPWEQQLEAIGSDLAAIQHSLNLWMLYQLSNQQLVPKEN